MKRIVILRPEPGASETRARAVELGLETLLLPLFKLEPVPWEMPEPSRFDGLLLTSANAVRHGGEGLQQLRGLKAYCVGQTTAGAAREAGFDIAATGKAGVARILGSIAPDDRLLHLAGEDRTEIGEVKQRITPLTVYRSTELPMPEGFDRVRGSVALVHSQRAGRRFAQLVDQRAIDRSSVSLCAFSDNAAAEMGGGWGETFIAERPEEPSLLALARRMCNTAAS